MKLPNIIKNRITFGFSVNLGLILIILLELYLAYSSLYVNLDPQPADVLPAKIVKVDLKSYQATTDFIKKTQAFVPKELFLINQNPFKYK